MRAAGDDFSIAFCFYNFFFREDGRRNGSKAAAEHEFEHINNNVIM